YEITGRSPFASGVSHATHLVVLSLVEGEGPYITMLPKAEVQIDRESWHTLGMRGTGSCDIDAKSLFVRKADVVPLAPRQSSGPAYERQLYRMTIWPLVAALAAPALGVARAAIDELIELATIKTPFYTGKVLRDREVVQSQVARAEAKLQAARAYLHGAV